MLPWQHDLEHWSPISLCLLNLPSNQILLQAIAKKHLTFCLLIIFTSSLNIMCMETRSFVQLSHRLKCSNSWIFLYFFCFWTFTYGTSLYGLCKVCACNCLSALCSRDGCMFCVALPLSVSCNPHLLSDRLCYSVCVL